MSKKKKKKKKKKKDILNFKTTKSKIKISFMRYVVGLGLQITELKILFQSDIPPKSGKSTTWATTIFLFSVFLFLLYVCIK